MPTVAVTSGNIITITSDLSVDGVNQSPKVIVRAKKNVYSNITGTNSAPVFSLIDHQGNTIFTATFDGSGAQAGTPNKLNTKETLSDIIAAFNTWNGGLGVKNLQPERVYLARLTHNTNQAPTYTVVKNTTGYDVKFGVPSTGVYKFTHTNTFDATKAIYLAGGAAVGCDVNINADATDVILTTNGSAGTGSNTVLSNTSVTIRVQH